MPETYYLGRFAESTFNTSDVLGDAQVLFEDETHITARIDSQNGIALMKLANGRAWHVWHVDLRTAFDDRHEAAAAAERKMKIKTVDGEKPSVWSPFLWPA